MGTAYPEVFISYSRATAAEEASALYNALLAAGILAFLDTRAIAAGEGIAEEVFESLLRCRVAVIFVDARYFTRRYCVEELSTALAGYSALSKRGGTPEELREASRPVLVALPASGEHLEDLELLPPEVRGRSWPQANESQRLADLGVELLGTGIRTFGERLDALGELPGLRERLYETLAIPAPKRLRDRRVYHEVGLPPSIGDGFVGRSRELWDLHRQLAVREGGVAALTAALEGGGGFGKTRLALEYLHRYGPNEYPGGLFWLNADVAEDRLEAQQHAILRLLRPDVPELLHFKEGGRDAARELGEALRSVARSEQVLYVVDNVPEPEGDARPQPIGKWCPASGEVSLLVTSRSRQLEGAIRQFVVRELAPDAAVRLLLHNYDDRNVLNDASWRRIANWVGEWPLALELLNAALRMGAISPAELVVATNTPPAKVLDRQMATLSGAVAEGTLRGVAEALEISYRRLTGEAQMAARQLAWLAPDPIPTALVARLMSPGVRVQLRARSFVSGVRSQAGVEMFGRVHRVLADFLRGETAETTEPAAELIALCGAIGAMLSWDACDNPEMWPLLDACRPHAEAVIERGLVEALGPEIAELVLDVQARVGRLLSAEGELGLARDLRERMLEASRRFLGEEHPDTLSAMADLAHTLRGQGEVDRARDLGERLLEARGRILGEEHAGTLSAMANLAATLRDQGELGRARELEERVLEARQRLLGEEHPGTLTAMANLAATLRDQSEHGRARELEERVLEARRRLLGEEHPDTLSAIQNLAHTLWTQGELGRARELEEQVLEARRRLLGGEHLHTLTAMGNLAATLRDQGELDRARQLEEQVLEARRRLLGEEHPHTVAAMANLAHTLRDQGKVERAKDLGERVLEVRQRLLGEEHPHTVLAMANLAATLHGQGELDRARQLEERALEASRRLLGGEHLHTLTAMASLAATVRNQGELDRARELQEQVLEASRRLFGEEHPDTLTAIQNLAHTLWTQGELDRARELEEKVLEARRRLLGEEHPHTLTAMANLAHTLRDQGEVVRARELEERALEARRRLLGEEHT